MDQRLKGGSPPTTHSTLDPTFAPEDSEQEQVAEKQWRDELENGHVGGKEEGNRGRGRKRNGDKGAVLELLIEGRCGSAGQQQLQISGRETSCPEGDVRLQIGLQAKRTKKPPKILESYVCKPTIRTYQRQSRGGMLRGVGEGGLGQKSKKSSTPEHAIRDQRSGLDAVQTTSKQTASAASPPPLASSSPTPILSSQPVSLPPPLTTASDPASVPALTKHESKSAKQVTTKRADKTKVNSNGSSERVTKDTLPSVNGQPVPAGHRPSSPTTDETASATPSTPCIPALETRNEGKNYKKQNVMVHTKKTKRLFNGKGTEDSLGTSNSLKNKFGKHNSSSTVSSMDCLTTPLVATNSPKELSLPSKSRPSSPSSPTVTPKPQSSPTLQSSSAQAQSENPSLQPTIETKKNKERKERKDKQKVKKSKRDRFETEWVKRDSRLKEGKAKKKEKGKEGTYRHGKEKDDRLKADDAWMGALKTERSKGVKTWTTFRPDGQRTEISDTKCGETGESDKLDKAFKIVNDNRSEDINKRDDSFNPVKQADPETATRDMGKSKEQEICRHSAVPPYQPFSAAPPALPNSSHCAPIHPVRSPQEQDSRPLKKRNARRSSWTKQVHRTQRTENQEAVSDFQLNASFPLNSKKSPAAKATIQQNHDESSNVPSSSLTSSSSALPSANKPPSPKQNPPTSDPSPPASRCSITPIRKRGRPKSQSSILAEHPPRLFLNSIPTLVPLLQSERIQNAPLLESSPVLHCTAQFNSSPKKRGRPPKRSFPEDHIEDALKHTHDQNGTKHCHPLEKGGRQIKIRRLINEMNKRKKRILHKAMFSGYAGKDRRGDNAGDGRTSQKMCKPVQTTTVNTFSALSSSFGNTLGPQINVSKRGTIYMGKRRGRKPKTQTAPKIQTNSHISTHSFTNHSEPPLFSSQPQPPPPHPFPSPSLTHSSGAQSPYSEGSLTEPTSSLHHSHPFSLPSPSSSCTSPRPPSSSSLSPFVKKSCPCQGRHHFPFHQSSCKLSCPTPPLHHTPGSPSQLKEATLSPRSESHSEETLPSDSGIGTDNNSVSERGEIRGARGILRLGQGVILKGQRHSSAVNHPSPMSSPLSHIPRLTNPITNSATVERHRERHRHRRRNYDCPSTCTCLCTCPCPGHNKCTHSDFIPCLGHNAMKRQKNKNKKKHQQLHLQDPEYLAELEDMIVQFSDVHIGRPGWMRTGLGQGFDGTVNATSGGKRLHSPHSPRSNIFRLNLNGFYSPHPSSYSTNTSFSPQSFFPCQPLQCNRKLDRRQCGCPSKFQDTIENMAFYNNYPHAATLYHHLPSSYPPPSSHQYAPHQPHHAHFLLNPTRFHRRRNRFLREGALGGEVEGNIGGGRGRGRNLTTGFTSGLSCSCGRSEHKHKHKHRHRHCDRDMDDEEELHGEKEEDGLERQGLAHSKQRPGYIFGQGGWKGARENETVLSKESPWLCEKENDSFSMAAATSSLSSAERYKRTSLTSLGLGSSHLSSFGGGWGGLGQSWMKYGHLRGTIFANSNTIGKGFAGEQHTIASDGEDHDDDDEDVEDLQLHRTPPSPTHTNLFTSAAITNGGRGMRSGLTGRNPGSGDRSCRRDQPAWTERRESGLQGDWRCRGQQKGVPTRDSVAENKKRRPGRPRKHPVPATVSSPLHSSAVPSMSSFELLPGHSNNSDGREVGGRKDEREPERDRGGFAVNQVTEFIPQARRKRGRKRKHGYTLCHQSLAEDEPENDDSTGCFSQSGFKQSPFKSPKEITQREERANFPPRKKFLRAGLYSDYYKTKDPPSQSQKSCRDTLENTPEERGYTLLPAPIHVGKYLRLKRINFQLPYDVMWLWQHNQLQRPPSVPLKRKRRYCRLKERTVSSPQTAEDSSSDIHSLFPHLDMEPLTSCERSFVVKHHVFLVRNLELVRERQIRLRIAREREAEGEERDSQSLSGDEVNGDDSHIKSDQPVGVEVEVVICSNPHHQSQDSSNLLTASVTPTTTQSKQEEDGEEEKPGGEEVCSREQRRKRLNDLLLTLQHS